MEKHRAGFVNIIGRPNVGKSTLLNALVGEKLSIITSKAQTTRQRIFGIMNGDGYQVVLSDTPGIIKPNYELQRFMLKSIRNALLDADIVLYLTDVIEKPGSSLEILERIKKSRVPVLLVINKIDLTPSTPLDKTVAYWKELLPQAEIFPASALKRHNTQPLFNRILELLPEGDPFFPKDQLTDKSERYIVSEIIREKILKLYKEEVPYSVEVEVESFKEEEHIINISAIVYVLRESQKGIIIGKRGEALKKVGTYARKDAEAFFGKKIFLELLVKVNKDWRDNATSLRKFGYRK